MIDPPPNPWNALATMSLPDTRRQYSISAQQGDKPSHAFRRPTERREDGKDENGCVQLIHSVSEDQLPKV